MESPPYYFDVPQVQTNHADWYKLGLRIGGGVLVKRLEILSALILSDIGLIFIFQGHSRSNLMVQPDPLYFFISTQ